MLLDKDSLSTIPESPSCSNLVFCVFSHYRRFYHPSSYTITTQHNHCQSSSFRRVVCYPDHTIRTFLFVPHSRVPTHREPGGFVCWLGIHFPLDESHEWYSRTLYSTSVRQLSLCLSWCVLESFDSPDREVPPAIKAPIEYSSLREEHLSQIHDLLQRVFWEGIDSE